MDVSKNKPERFWEYCEYVVKDDWRYGTLPDGLQFRYFFSQYPGSLNPGPPDLVCRDVSIKFPGKRLVYVMAYTPYEGSGKETTKWKAKLRFYPNVHEYFPDSISLDYILRLVSELLGIRDLFNLDKLPA